MRLEVLRMQVALAIVLTPHFIARAADPGWTFNDLQAAITKVQLSGDRGSEEQRPLEDISESVSILRHRYLQAYGPSADGAASINANISEQYSRSVAADISSLQSLPTTPEARLAILEDIQNDLRLKVSFTPTSFGATSSFPSVISVTVDTIGGVGQEISGLWVRCNPQRYGITQHPLFIFDSASTPTVSLLPPGRLIMWVEDGKGKVLMSQPISLGDGGRADEHIKVVIP